MSLREFRWPDSQKRTQAFTNQWARRAPLKKAVTAQTIHYASTLVGRKREPQDIVYGITDFSEALRSIDRAVQNAEKPQQTGAFQRLLAKGCYFRDGKRPVDYVLAFEDDRDITHAKYRRHFESRLVSAGLELQYESSSSEANGKKGLSFVKIHAPWDFLTAKAEALERRMPFCVSDVPLKCPKSFHFATWFVGLFGRPSPFTLQAELDAPEPDFCTLKFERCHQSMFLISPENRDAFFTPAQRISLVDHTLRHIGAKRLEDIGAEETVSQKCPTLALAIRNHAQFLADVSAERAPVEYQTEPRDLYWLLQQKIYTAVYPLHDADPIVRGSKEKDEFDGQPQKVLPYRRWLSSNWANLKMWYKHQPIQQIHAYLGEKPALYFAWIGEYNKYLLAATPLSFICVLYGVITLPGNDAVAEICMREDTVCRLCSANACPYEQLNNFCGYAKLSHIFDNESTIFFAIALSIWSVILCQAWKRKQNELTELWDSKAEATLKTSYRPQFLNQVKTTKYNALTREHEPRLMLKDKCHRKAVSCATALFFCLLSMACIAAVAIYRAIAYVFAELALDVNENVHLEFITNHLPLLVMISSCIFNTLVVLILKAVYRKVAYKLTEYECPRTQEEFETSFTYKVVSFQFVNYFGSLYYVAFLKGKMYAPHNQPAYAMACAPSGCLAEVCVQLITHMTVLPIIQNLMEYALPFIRVYFHKLRQRTGLLGKPRTEPVTRCEQDYGLIKLSECYLFDEYLEMTLQYGILTMFAAAFPLGVLLALLNNVFELRLDAKKFLHAYQRPVANRETNLEPWQKIIEVITALAVMFYIDRTYYVRHYHGDVYDNYVKHMFTIYDCDDIPRDNSSHSCHHGQAGVVRTFVIHNGSNPLENITVTRVEHFCLFRDWRHDYNSTSVGGKAGLQKYSLTYTHWRLMTIRFGFFFAFEHLVFLLQAAIRWTVGDVPKHMRVRKKREADLSRQLVMRQLAKRHRSDTKDASVLVANDNSSEVSQTSVNNESLSTAETNVLVLPIGTDDQTQLRRRGSDGHQQIVSASTNNPKESEGREHVGKF